MSLPARPSNKSDTRAIWEWLHRTNELTVADTDFDPAALSPEGDTKLRTAAPLPRYEITRREQRAIRRGFYLLSRKQPDAWAEVRRCLEAEAVSRDFRRLVARMIEGNILHDRGQVPNALDRADTMRRRGLYVNLLKQRYVDLGELKHGPLAERLVAFDLCLDYHDRAEPYEVADWSAFLKEFDRFAARVKSICDPHRGTDKASKGIGAEVLAAVTTARLIA
ncbi:hypothetical protein [Rhizobium sp. M1]|uniref:hypothetical protein n=1 Tax=Rhizobium sp. M1 TaxID=2035453 RepID=UPI000BE92B2B|nr:hypothetical protein [Rhizobium sp. M1]PDT07872.1 hypothetical protein CO655_24940 [Rhizobium sp. M1]